MACIIDIIAAGISFLSLIIAIISMIIAKRAMDFSAKLFKKQYVMELHKYWTEIQDITRLKEWGKAEQGKVARKAVNALHLTSTLWNHDIIEKTIIYQNHWIDFKSIYDYLKGHIEQIELLNKSGPQLLSPEITNAYDSMKVYNPVITTQTNP